MSELGMLGKKSHDFLTVIDTFYQVLTLLPLTTTFYQLLMVLPTFNLFTSYYLLNQFLTVFIIGPQSRLSLYRVAWPVEKIIKCDEKPCRRGLANNFVE